MTKTRRMTRVTLWLLLCALSISACGGEEAEPAAPAQETQEPAKPARALPAEPQAPEPPARAEAATAPVVPLLPRPDAIPSDLPQLAGFTTQEVSGDSGASYQVVLSGPGDPEAIRQSYEAELVKFGWSVDVSTELEDGHITLASQADRSISLSLTRKSEQVEAIFSFIDPTRIPQQGAPGEEGEPVDDPEGAAEYEGMAEDPPPTYPDDADGDGGEAGEDEAQD